MTSELKQVVDGLSREANGAATEALLVAGSNALRGTGMLSRDDDALTHQVPPRQSRAGRAVYIYIYMRSRYACTERRHAYMKDCRVYTGRRHVYVGSRPPLNPCRAGGRCPVHCRAF